MAGRLPSSHHHGQLLPRKKEREKEKNNKNKNKNID